MLKKLGTLSAAVLALFGCQFYGDDTPEPVVTTAFQQPTIKMPTSIVVCRARQCAPAKLSTSKEFIYNTLLHLFDSNARKKAPICAAEPNTHACTEEFLSIPITVGITPAYMYIDDVKITDVSISNKNTAALNLILNWNVSYNGQTPICRPSKTLMYVKNVNNVVMEDNGYNCKMTTIGTSTIKTLFAIDYIDLDFGYIGGFYSIGLSGPAFGGGSGYMIIRLPEEISLSAKDFQPTLEQAPVTTYIPSMNPLLPTVSASQTIDPTAGNKKTTEAKDDSEGHTPAPNVDTIIKYNHASIDYDKAKVEMVKKKKEEAKAVDYDGVKVFPVKSTNIKPEPKMPKDKNILTEYRKY